MEHQETMPITKEELEKYRSQPPESADEVIYIRLNFLRALIRVPFIKTHIAPLLRRKTLLRYALGFGALLITYTAAAYYSLELYSPVDHFAPLIWLPSGIVVAALFLYGYELAPAAAVGAFIVNSWLGAPTQAAFGIALGTMLQGIVAVYCLRRFEFDPLFARLRDSLGFIAISLCSSIIAPTLNVASLYVSHRVGDTAQHMWLAWWIGTALGMLIWGPFLIRWLLRPDFHRPKKSLIEAIGVLVALCVVSLIVFWTPDAQIGPFSLAYLLFVPLGWGALRIGPRAMTLGIALVSIVASSAVASHAALLPQVVVQQELVSLQLFMAFVVMLFLPLTSMVEDRKNVTLSLEEKNRQLGLVLERLNSEDQAKNEFMAILAHELRNPLAPVVSSLELMKIDMEKSGRTDQAENLETAATHLHTITTLLDDLLDISRITRRKLNLKIEEVELQSVINHAIHTIESFFKSQNIDLSTSVPKKPIYVQADPVRLEQVLVNVLHNAAKYTESGGKAMLSVVTDPERGVRIAVKDTGIGMTRAIMEKIFEPFMQAAEKPAVGGLGIGLYLTQRLVELHGGRIWAESEGPGRGSEFIIVLPHHHTPAAEEQAPATLQNTRAPFLKHSPSEEKKHRILLVDDNEAAAKALSALLIHKGHDVTVCHHGTAALRQMEDIDIDVGLLDIGLPDMDGYTLARAMRELYANRSLTLIALTGYGQEEDKEKARKAGFTHHLTKPVGLADIEKLLP